MRATISISPDMILVGARGRVAAVPVDGLGGALRMLPAVIEQMAASGMTELRLAGEAREGRLPAAHWLLFVKKGNQELEEARQRCLDLLQQHSVSVVSDYVVADDVAAIGGLFKAAEPAAKEDPFE